MGKALQGAAMLGGALALGGAMMMDPALLVTPMMDKLMVSLVVGGVSMEAGAVANALTHNRGMNITTRQPASFRQIVYGTQRIGGVIIYRSTTGSHHDQYNYVIVLATHEIAAIEALYLDGRRVHFESGSSGQKTSPDGTAFGGFADSNTYSGPNGQHYNFGSLVYCEARFGDQADGDVIGGLTANDPKWAADGSGNSPYVGGCAYVYLKVEYDASMFPGEPEIRFTVRGKNDIFDPRSNAKGYTDNWALIVADVITDPKWGLGDNNVNQAQLIAAANVCDEQVSLAAGGTESRYCCHYHYDTSTSPGNAIETMMSAAAGRLSRIGGEWYLWPAYWQGPTLSFGIDDLADADVEWQPNRPISELFNRVAGTYIAPNYPYNVAGNLYDSNGWYDGSIQNNFPFAFQPTNYPEYAADELHGYGTGVDVYLTEDGGLYLPKEIAQPCVLSITQAQRLAKINLLRNRQQGSGLLTMGMTAMQAQPIDVMQFTFAAYGWTNKQLEIQGPFQWVVDHDAKTGAPRISFKVPVGETDQSVYEWATTEELTPYDVPASPLGVPYTVDPPTNVTIEDDSTTVQTLADGTTVPRLLVSWTPPTDVYVNTGGKIEVQYQFATTTGIEPVILSPALTAGNQYASAWIDAGAVSGDGTFLFINGITPEQYQQINVRVRAVRASGATSAWTEIDNHPLSVSYPNWPIKKIGSGSGPVFTFADSGKTLADLEPAEAGADVTAQNTAKDTSLVNGVPSGTVSQGATGINANLVPDSGLQFGWTYWGGAPPSASWEIFSGGQAGGALNSFNVYNAGGSPGALYSAPFLLRAGTYTLAYEYAGFGITSGSPNLNVRDVSSGAVYGSDYPAANSSGRRTFTFSLSADATVQLLLDPYQVVWSSGGTGIRWGAFMLQSGSVATAYVPNALDNTTGSWLHGAMSNEVRGAIESGSGNVLNLGGTAAADITPIANLMPAQAGADNTAESGFVTLQNPSFQRGSSGWSLGTHWILQSGYQSQTGSSYYAQFEGGSSFGAIVNNQKIICGPNDIITATAQCWITTSVAGPVGARVDFYDGSGSFIRSAYGNDISGGPYSQVTYSRVVATAPSNVAYAVVGFAVNTSTSTYVNLYALTAHLNLKSMDELPDGATYKRPLYIENGVYTTSKGIVNQGSLAVVSEGGDGSICSAECNASTITVTWIAFDIYAPDGTVYSVPANSTGVSFTGLSSSTVYYFAAWYNIASGQVTVQNIGTSQASLQYQVQTVQADGNVGIAINFTFSTTNSLSTSTGSPTPPPTGTCFSPDTLVEVVTEDGLVARRIIDVQPGDRIMTLAGTIRPVWYVTSQPYKGPMQVVPGIGLSTPTHQMWDGSCWVDAQTLYPEVVEYDGTMHNLHIDATTEDEHSYMLGNGQIVHNIFTNTSTYN